MDKTETVTEKTTVEKAKETAAKTTATVKSGLQSAGRKLKNGVEAVTKNFRAAVRMGIALAATPVFIGLAALQAFVVRPLTGNQSVIPNLIYNASAKLIGLKIKFNAASAPVEKKKSTWYVANHLSNADFLSLGAKLDGTFAGKGDIMKWPVVSQMARALKYIGLRRSSEYNAESRAKLVKNFNDGQNAIMFPEGTTSDGSKVHLFRAALPSLLYGEAAVDKDKKEVKLEKDVVVQPVAIQVKTVNGKDATSDAALRDLYSMYNEENMLTRVWKRMQVREITVELTAMKPLNPKDFKDAKELMNKAALDIATVVNPGQTTFTKAEIPSQPQKPANDTAKKKPAAKKQTAKQKTAVAAKKS
ncbi:MAG: 1-acyl-sn-glycerol-3-phosphate acyltransferase [Alphaproteobacteria bacterium]|nr:MAG: 1-acyl-sn-glycerol-3-phosphate acyltransferase [Alphaproteobacteria bacterium]